MKIKVQLNNLSDEQNEALNQSFTSLWEKSREKFERAVANEVDHAFGDFLMIRVDKDTLVEYYEWRRKVSLPDDEQGTIGGQFTYCITPTSLGVIYVVKHCKGEEFNLTNFAIW